MEYREATDRERDIVRALIERVTLGVMAGCPSEEEYPGVSGMVVTALVHVAGELLQGVPEAQRPGILAHYQQYLAAAAGLPQAEH